MNKKFKKEVVAWLSILVIFASLFTNSVLAPVKARNITVPVDYPDIQAALNSALDGDVITVLKGTYKGFEVGKSVTIIGESSQTVTVVGDVVVRADDVKISSMKIVLENSSSGLASAIEIYGSNATLTNLIVESDSSGIQVGDLNHENASALIKYVTVIAGKGGDYYGNPAGVWGVCNSLYIHYSNITLLRDGTSIVGCGYTQLMFSSVNSGGTSVRVSKGEIKNNTVSGSQVGVVVSGGNVIVEFNSVSSGGIGVDIFQSNGNIVSGNTIVSLDTGIRVVGRNNVLSKNKVSSGGSAIELRGDSNVVVNNTLSGGRGVNGLNAYGNIIAFNFINMTGSIGIYMSEFTGSNLVYGNTFWYCYNYNAADESGGNQWYIENESLRIGNYWYDHTTPDSNGDGIVDTPYTITTTTGLQILDKYPLASPAVGITWRTTTTLSTTLITSTPSTSRPAETSPQQSITESTEKLYTYTPISFIAFTALLVAIVVAIILLLMLKRTH